MMNTTDIYQEVCDRIRSDVGLIEVFAEVLRDDLDARLAELGCPLDDIMATVMERFVTQRRDALLPPEFHKAENLAHLLYSIMCDVDDAYNVFCLVTQKWATGGFTLSKESYVRLLDEKIKEESSA